MSALLLPFQHFSNLLYHYTNNEMSSFTDHSRNSYDRADCFATMRLQNNKPSATPSISFWRHGLLHPDFSIDYGGDAGGALLATPPQSSEDGVADCQSLGTTSSPCPSIHTWVSPQPFYPRSAGDGVPDYQLVGTESSHCPGFQHWMFGEDPIKGLLPQETFSSVKLPVFGDFLATSCDELPTANNAQPVRSLDDLPTPSPGSLILGSPISEDPNRPTDSSHRIDERNPHVATIQEQAAPETLPASPSNHPSPRVDSATPPDTDEERQPNSLKDTTRGPSRKRTATPVCPETPSKRMRQGTQQTTIRGGVHARLMQVTTNINGRKRHLKWERHKKVWYNKSVKSEWNSNTLKDHILANLLVSSLEINPGGGGYLIDLKWCEEKNVFKGSSDMGRYNVKIGMSDLPKLLETQTSASFG